MENSGQVREKILKTVDKRRGEIVTFLRDLIREQSVTEKEAPIQEFIAGKLKEMGLKVDVWEPSWNELKKHPGYVPVKVGYEGRPNVVGVYKGRGKGKSLIFNGHVDVVPSGPLEGWPHDPWGGQVEGGKVYGRGASDMKSGLAAMTMALKCVLEAGVKPKGDVILEYVMDEEYSGNGTLACILRGYKADAAVNCEASDLEVQPAHTGSMWFNITVKGRSASMSRIWEAMNAVEKGYRVFRAVSDFETIRLEKRHPLYADPRAALACFVGMFHSGSYPSIPPDLCLIRGRMGVLPNEDPREVQRTFIEHIGKIADRDPWLKNHKPEVVFTGYMGEPAEIPPDHPICKTVEASFEEATGRRAVVKGHEGCTDSRLLIKHAETPTVIFGPGTITQMHAADEWVKIDDLIDSVKTMALTIVNWCGCQA
jgi:acetylornithine deacetylase